MEEWKNGRKGMVEKVRKETRFRRSLFPSVGGYPLVLERGCANEGASLKVHYSMRSSEAHPPPICFLAGVSVFHISTTSFISAEYQLTDARQSDAMLSLSSKVQRVIVVTQSNSL